MQSFTSRCDYNKSIEAIRDYLDKMYGKLDILDQ